MLDLGCVGSPLSAIAARMGHRVTAADLRPIEYSVDGVTFFHGDLRKIQGSNFDAIMNCSMIEHVGLPERYGEHGQPDGGIDAMRFLHQTLNHDGRMLLTEKALSVSGTESYYALGLFTLAA